MLGRYALIAARGAAAAARPLERFALLSLRLFMTPRGPLLFLAFMLLLIGALLALVIAAPGPGAGAAAKLGLGMLSFALFCGYLRAYFAVKSETEAALAGLMRDNDAETVEFAPDVPDRLSPSPRYPGVLSLFDLLVFVIGLAAAHTAVAAGLLEGGFGPVAFDAGGAQAQPGPLDWALYAAWATLGALDPLGLLARPGENVWGLRYEWGWAIVWLYAYRLILLGVLFSLASAAFDARRKVAIALSRPGLWWEKRQHLQRLGRSGFLALSASLADPDPARREDAAHMLGAVGGFPEEAAEALRSALADPSDAVRERAAESLGALGPAAAEASADLTGRLLDGSTAVRRKAAAALGAVAGARNDLAHPAMAALASAIPEDPSQIQSADWETLAAMAKSLAELALAVGAAPEAAIKAVDRLRGHPEAYVRQTAVEAYGQLKSAAQARAQREAEERAAAQQAEWASREWPSRTEWER